MFFVLIFSLNVRNNDESRQPPEPIDLGEPYVFIYIFEFINWEKSNFIACRPTVEEAKGWAESFDKLMLSPGKSF